MTRRLYLDACVIIETRENQSAYAIALLDIVVSSRRNGIRLITSELSLAEVLVEPLRWLKLSPRESAPHLQCDWYRGNLVPGGQLFDAQAVTRAILESAASIRVDTPTIKLPDAIHIATAIASECDVFLTGDRRLVQAASFLAARGLTKQLLFRLMSTAEDATAFKQEFIP